ncbi:MAG: hypothetical protein RR136_01000 [Clostridia bacterium]
MKKFLKYITVFVFIGIVITVSILAFANNFIYSLSNSSSIYAENNNLKNTDKEKTIKIEDDAMFQQYSFNNKYYSYLKDGKIIIKNIEKGEIYDTIEEDEKICFYNLLYDKNLILYFTENKIGNSSKLVLKTYDISSKNKAEFNKFTINNFSKIKQIEFSPIINIIYLNIETKSGLKENNIVYRIDLFNSKSTVVSGKIISNLTMLKHKDRLYYEDDNNKIYYAGSRLNIFGEDVHLIGTDLDDNIYFISAKNKNKIYKVQNNKIIEKIELTDTDVINWYSDNTNVYLIYPTYILNISSKSPYKRLAKLSEFVAFETIKENTLYLRTKDNLIVSTKLLNVEN